MYAMRAVIITAFIDGNFLTLFPFKEGMMATWAEVFSFIIFTESFIELEEVITELT